MDELQCSSAVFNVGATLGVEVSINGPQGEDTVNGDWAEIVLTNLAMMDMSDESGRKDRLVIKTGGGMETALLANGLVWAGQELLRLTGVGPVEPESLTS
jgi:hypothetical protein